MGTVILVTVIIPDWDADKGVVFDVEDMVDVDGVEEGENVVVDESGELEELDELAGEGADIAGGTLERKAGAFIFDGLVVEGRDAGGGGLAETVRGGKIVE